MRLFDRDKSFSTVCPGGAEVEHSARNPKIEGLNPSTGNERERENGEHCDRASNGGMLVEQWIQSLRVQM